MKKINMIMSVIIMSFLVMALPERNVEAKGGSIRIELEKGEKETLREGVEFSYAKVADIVNGEIANAKFPDELQREQLDSAEGQKQAALAIEKRIREWDGTVCTDVSGKAIIQNVDEGMYFIAMTNRNSYDEVQPILVTMPIWNEKTGNMEYDVCVIPKHEPAEKPVAPQTNLESNDKKKVIGASLCALGGVLFLAFLCRRGEDEEYL